MSCSCKETKKTPTAVQTPRPRLGAVASKFAKELNSIACRDCLDKHLGAAAEYAKESEEDYDRVVEFRRAIGNLVCAEDHARALGLYDFAARIRRARKTFQASRKASDVEDLLKEGSSK